jgi:hypothetical protein
MHPSQSDKTKRAKRQNRQTEFSFFLSFKKKTLKQTSGTFMAVQIGCQFVANESKWELIMASHAATKRGCG